MGKTTLYHPVSLHVIRGALDYGGFAVGRIRQVWANRETGMAGYVCELVKAPKGFMAQSPRNQVDQLNGLFSNDITVTHIATCYGGRPRRRATNIRIETALHPNSDPHLHGEKQPLLPDLQEPVGEFTDWSLIDDGFSGPIEQAAYIADQRAQREEYDIPF